MPSNSNIYINTDGGSRGNPGTSACAFVVSDWQDQFIFEAGFVLGFGTNNQAEYQGVLKALDWLTSYLADHLDCSDILFRLDSQLVVRQLQGIYRVKDQNIFPLYSSACKTINSLTKKYNCNINFLHIPREQNSRADFVLNQTLDK